MPLNWNDAVWNYGLWDTNESFIQPIIKILDSDFKRLGNIKNVLSCTKTEEINSEYTLNFESMLDNKLNGFLNENSIFELDNDYFDVAYLEKDLKGDGSYLAKIESEHISYRLNDPAYNTYVFTETGTPAYIMGKILEGTGFTVGIIEYTDAVTYSIQEGKSRRQLLMEFVEYLGGEVLFNKFSIGIVHHLGSFTPKLLREGKNINIISKKVDKRTLDENGNYLVSVECTPIYQPGDSYQLGDDLYIIEKNLNIYEQLRIVRYTHNPYMNEITFDISNSISTLADSMYQIETSTVTKDKVYNGCKIGPEFGFEAIRSDLKARAFFRSDGMYFQVGDGSGDPNMWVNKLYYDYDSENDETILVFDGVLSATVVEALSALITPNLYAEKATISELTVDSLETSKKVQKYLAGDKSDVNYVRIYEQTMQFITAMTTNTYSPSYVNDSSWEETTQVDTYYSSVTINQETGAILLSGGTPTQVSAGTAYDTGFRYKYGDADTFHKLTSAYGGNVYYTTYDVIAGMTQYEQAKTLKNELLYWVDETHKASSTDVTEYPVYQYIYMEQTKQSISFEYDSVTGAYIPVAIYGAGTGNTETSGQGRLQKNTDGLVLEYNTGDGLNTAGVYLRDDGFTDVTGRRAGVNVNTTAKTITVSPEGTEASPVVINYVEVGNKLTLTWPDGKSFDVEVNS